MKKINLALLMLPALLLAACATGNEGAGSLSSDSSSSESKPVTPPTSEDLGMDIVPDPIKVYFYESASLGDKYNYFLLIDVLPDSLIPAPETDPVSSDPAFNKFLGWCAHPVAMTEDDYWNFDEDKTPKYQESV